MHQGNDLNTVTKYLLEAFPSEFDRVSVVKVEIATLCENREAKKF